MKLSILCLVFLFVTLSCSRGTSTISPNGLTGIWQLSKISSGYPPPNGPNFTLRVPNEQLSLNESKKTFIIKKDNALVESGSFELKEDLKNPNGTKIIQFMTDDTFSNYSFPVNINELVLYQRTKVGGILADGSSYHYSRVLLE